MKGDWYFISKSCDNSEYIEIRILQESESKEMQNLRSDSDFRLKICLDKIIFEIWLVIRIGIFSDKDF